MLTLYYKSWCGYCQNVLREAEALGVSLGLKDVESDPAFVDEFISFGGKQEVPFLIDDSKGVQMYESEDIIRYLQEQSADATTPKTFGGLNIHKTGEVCKTSV
jgi:glutathione S-transferase